MPGPPPVLTVESAEEGEGGVSGGQKRRQGGDAVKRTLIARRRDCGRDGHDGLLVFRDGRVLDEGEGDTDEEVPSAVVEERLAFRRRGHDAARELAQFSRAAAGPLRPKGLLCPLERIEPNRGCGRVEHHVDDAVSARLLERRLKEGSELALDVVDDEGTALLKVGHG